MKAEHNELIHEIFLVTLDGKIFNITDDLDGNGNPFIGLLNDDGDFIDIRSLASNFFFIFHAELLRSLAFGEKSFSISRSVPQVVMSDMSDPVDIFSARFNVPHTDYFSSVIMSDPFSQVVGIFSDFDEAGECNFAIRFRNKSYSEKMKAAVLKFYRRESIKTLRKIKNQMIFYCI